MSDETPDVIETRKSRYHGRAPYSYRPETVDDMKVWYESKVLITAAISFALFMLKHLEVISWSNELMVQVQTFLITLGLFLARLSNNKRLVTRKTFIHARNEYMSQSKDEK